MVSVTTYQIYLSGSLPSPGWSGDIDSATRNITTTPGAAVIEITLSGLLGASGQPVTFPPPPSSPITFLKGGEPVAQPSFVSWALMSPTQILITDMNFNTEPAGFELNLADGEVIVFGASVHVDPTIVNTYVPPLLPAEAASGRPPAAGQQGLA
jgi:hypothetical protein